MAFIILGQKRHQIELSQEFQRLCFSIKRLDQD